MPLNDPNVEGFQIVSSLVQTFWNKKDHKFVNGNNCSDSINGTFCVWPVAVVVQGIVDAARINKNYVPLMYDVLQSFNHYYDPNNHAYTATEYFDGNDDIYYDDNAQVASCFLTAYEITQDKAILDRGLELVNFLMTGRTEEGAVSWHVSKRGPNACTTAEVGIACARLARFVENSEPYIKFAQDCHYYIFSKLIDGDGLVRDSDHEAMKWTYNQGTPLTLSALLYNHTKNEAYFKNAQALVNAVTDTNQEIFDRDTGDHSKRFYRDSLKFYQLLCEGFADFTLFFGEKDQEATQKIADIANRHLFLIFTYMRFPGEASLYSGELSINKIDETRCDIFNKLTGENKGFECEGSEREGGDGSKNLVPNFMNAGAASRVFFQTARILPHVNF